MSEATTHRLRVGDLVLIGYRDGPTPGPLPGVVVSVRGEFAVMLWLDDLTRTSWRVETRLTSHLMVLAP